MFLMLKNTFQYAFNIVCPFLPFNSTPNVNTLEAHSFAAASRIESVEDQLRN
jgi:hypothetical protein